MDEIGEFKKAFQFESRSNIQDELRVGMIEREIYLKAIELWGVETQIKMAIEECAELIKALAKHGRKINSVSISHIQDEIVDVGLMLNQLKEIFPTDYELIKKEKLERLLEYFKKEEVGSG